MSVGIAILVVAAALVGAAVAGGSDDDSQDANAANVRRDSGLGDATAADPFDDDVPRSTDPPTTTTSTTTTTTAPPTTLDPETAAREAIERRIAEDRPRVEAQILDWWVPQISSKRLGITDEAKGITYDTYQSILEDFQSQVDRFGDVLLLDSGAYGTFKEGGLWVAVANAPFATPEGANGWCDSAGLPPSDCFAKLVSNTAPAEGSTVYRG